ncbi:probable protein phosphatase 2C 72 [Cucurbita maxima]|uniref:protein-serine/threonine phosphatase n=1 Tax=Cucurbita maxima TaxID=3661 RepID=A0A6J1J2J0_CUCMA|nr:probable protein phosphatase 2C 72 [Cucurbita maxima]
MGICISAASSQIRHETKVTAICTTNELGFEEQRPDSVCSKQGNKGINQDAAFVYQEYGEQGRALFGVFDGHGTNGHTVSNMAKNRLPPLLLSAMSKAETNFVGWKEAMVTAFKVMDKEIKLQETLDCSFSGTTAVIILKQGEDLVIANLGDSRAVMGRVTDDDIEAVQLTTDLKPGLPDEAERIRNCNGRVLALQEEPHIQRVWLPNEDAPGLAMSRAFGDFALKEHGIIALPDVSHRRLAPDDHFIVLATDGIWDVLSNNEVASIVSKAESEEAAAKAVVEAATEAWKRYPASKLDDCTVVCHFLQNKRQWEN